MSEELKIISEALQEMVNNRSSELTSKMLSAGSHVLWELGILEVQGE